MSNQFDPPTEEHRVPLLKPEVVEAEGVLQGDVVGEYDTYESATDTGAVIALVFAGLSFVVLPVIGAIIALFIATAAKHRIRRSDGRLGGATLARAAQIIAVANIVLCAVLAYFIVQLVQWLLSMI